jgi:hypothetical protein
MLYLDPPLASPPIVSMLNADADGAESDTIATTIAPAANPSGVNRSIMIPSLRQRRTRYEHTTPMVKSYHTQWCLATKSATILQGLSPLSAKQ